MSSIKYILILLITSCSVFGQEKFTASFEIGLSDIRYEERVGMVISYKHLNLHGEINLQYKGFQLWALKTKNVMWGNSIATYGMAGFGKRVDIGNAFIRSDLALLMIQDKEFWDYPAKASYIPSIQIGYKFNDRDLIRAWYNHFHNLIGYGGGYDASVSYIRQESGLKTSFTIWRNSGIFLTQPSFNAGLTIELQKKLSWVEIRPEFVALLNITRIDYPDAPRYGSNIIGTQDALVFRINFLFGGNKAVKL